MDDKRGRKTMAPNNKIVGAHENGCGGNGRCQPTIRREELNSRCSDPCRRNNVKGQGVSGRSSNREVFNEGTVGTRKG